MILACLIREQKAGGGGRGKGMQQGLEFSLRLLLYKLSGQGPP